MTGARTRLLSLAAIAIIVVLARATHAQESGGSFGGSSWDDEPSGGGGGGGSDWGGGGGASSDWGAGSAPSGPDPAQAEAQRRASEAEIAAAAEAERQREAAERARRLALPPAARIAELEWPAAPAYPAVGSRRVVPLDGWLGERSPSGAWSPPVQPAIGAASHQVVGPPNVFLSTVCGMFPALFVAGLLLLGGRARGARGAPKQAARTAMRLSIAFDWTARAELQAALAAMATRFDLRNRSGLSDASRAMAALLDQHAGAARYVSWELASGDTRSWFQNRTQDLRARFRAELVRNDAVTQSPEYRAREHEGAGLVVVTVIVAGKTPFATPRAAFDLPSLRSAIASIADRPAGQTIALEVVWSPAAENDRMSSYELEKLYPELQRISEGVGARQCTYCRGPFPAELRTCPACGAPN